MKIAVGISLGSALATHDLSGSRFPGFRLRPHPGLVSVSCSYFRTFPFTTLFLIGSTDIR